jgi:hypothetical protein
MRDCCLETRACHATFLCPATLLWLLVGWLVATSTAQSSDASPSSGFRELQVGKRLTIVTDLPEDPSILELGKVFDEAFLQWCDYFGVEPSSVEDWKATMYLMLDRQRFERAGYIPDDCPQFPHGWQSDQRIWIMEQPSAFYRRHLMLHEGTHWFMLQRFGSYHAPWLAEGLAEWFGTHRWVDGRLQMRIIPVDRQEVPYWGRITLIQQQLEQGLAPGLEEIWRYDNSAHQQVDAYSWSWAMIQFLEIHPETSGVIDSLLNEQVKDVQGTYRWMRDKLVHRLPRLRTDWSAFVSDLDYGYNPEPGPLLLSMKTQVLDQATVRSFPSERGWQSTGLTVEAGRKFQVRSSGEYSIANRPRPWRCQPDGVTLEYHRGQPVGRVMMAIANVQPKAKSVITPLNVLAVGREATIVADQTGELFFRVNEAYGNLFDNQGTFDVQITPIDMIPE